MPPTSARRVTRAGGSLYDLIGPAVNISGVASFGTSTTSPTGRDADVIEVAGLRKAYGATVAVDGVSFDVPRGEIFALVGPNGAGKTTTIECVEGYREPDAGTGGGGDRGTRGS